jgi:hypothetical protein
MAREDVGVSTLLGMGAVIAAVLVICGIVGWLVDLLLGTGPVFLLLGVLVGIIGASAYTISQFRRYMSD